ncbi:MAG: GntR family transcriptional regulator [Devosia sp.]|uniref:GntR family transcriptional regulator n=1 Tax=Devosia sp. 66-22 TaxID=1895753 RepID=UPI0009276332|nr:GntR family transcriptional regulator [Devosia sp. 66-22]MBN9346852.1 GntR family transcriptional regulator [Devosia sp.]OJX52614.1 MAG: GntR family transcriptional regulator [Devosia sp. 66-22]
MFDDRSPIYRQIADRIKADVASGALGPDEQVMSTNQYASFYGINPATAQKAFQTLVDEGVLYKRRGLGMYVSPGAREALIAEKRTRYFDAVLGPALDEAMAIGISADELRSFFNARTKRQDQ